MPCPTGVLHPTPRKPRSLQAKSCWHVARKTLSGVQIKQLVLHHAMSWIGAAVVESASMSKSPPSTLETAVRIIHRRAISGFSQCTAGNRLGVYSAEWHSIISPSCTTHLRPRHRELPLPCRISWSRPMCWWKSASNQLPMLTLCTNRRTASR